MGAARLARPAPAGHRVAARRSRYLAPGRLEDRIIDPEVRVAGRDADPALPGRRTSCRRWSSIRRRMEWVGTPSVPIAVAVTNSKPLAPGEARPNSPSNGMGALMPRSPRWMVRVARILPVRDFEAEPDRGDGRSDLATDRDRLAREDLVRTGRRIESDPAARVSEVLGRVLRARHHLARQRHRRRSGTEPADRRPHRPGRRSSRRDHIRRAVTASAPAPATRPVKRADVAARSRGSVSADVDEDVLRLRVEVQRAHPELAADARHLVAAERRLGVDRAVRVHADDAGLEGLAPPAAPCRCRGSRSSPTGRTASRWRGGAPPPRCRTG